MTCPYPQGEPAQWCAWHQHDDEMLRAMEAREASGAIRLVPQPRLPLAPRKA